MSTFAAKFKRCLIPYFSILLLIGCSPEWHLKRAVQKDPSILQMKTMIVTDTVVTEPIVVKDTVTLSQVDTVEIVKDRFRVKIVRSYDTLMIDGGCDADTIIRTVTVSVPQLVAGETRLQRVQRYTFWGLTGLLLVAIAIIIIKRALPKGLL